MKKIFDIPRFRVLPLLLTVGLVTTFAVSAEVFSHAPRILKEGQKVTLRGVINDLTMPVPDSVESDVTQSGYFLIVPNECTIEAKDLDEETVIIHSQTIFHLTPSEEQQKQFEKIKGKPVEVVVNLMMAHTRYHRTPVLMNVESVKLLKLKE